MQVTWCLLDRRANREIDIAKLQHLALQFELTMDMDALHREADLDKSGEVNLVKTSNSHIMSLQVCSIVNNCGCVARPGVCAVESAERM